MALTLNTPGVYVEEISTLPPSVAQVATAVPAFIGYTAKATRTSDPVGTELTNVPTRITSLLEYVTYFGMAMDETNIVVTVTDGAIATSHDPALRKKYLMYYAMQMYFANGGGPCYIVSTGGYTGTITLADLQDGLAELAKEDEPTLIYFPDAINLGTSANFYALNKDALTQCHDLQDRFTIMDMPESSVTTVDVDTDITNFRAGMDSDEDYRKYGAAYYPYLKTILTYQYKDSGVSVTVTNGTTYDAQVQKISDTSVTNGQAAMTDFIADLEDYKIELDDNPPDTSSIRQNIRNTVLAVISTSNGLISALKNAVNIGRNVLSSADTEATEYTTLFTATNALDAWITDTLGQLNQDLNVNLDDLDALDPDASATEVNTVLSDTSDSIYASMSILATDNIADIINTMKGAELAALKTALTPYSTATSTTTNLGALKNTDNELYNRVKLAISQLPVLMPPGSSMAGIYARVDANDGVWKSPANVNVNYVIGPNVMLTNDQQGRMNIDDNAGKSINAIRTFTGKGILVWGARTLDGNSNEWRYISVRRFFNFAEESIKKATESFVFEANDANTWVKVRAMIENFLILQWKAGALAGPKPEQAFYVRVGLGQTMTPQDVLNGLMIVEVGMAVVRPAEFIVLRFSHLMQEA